MHMNNEQIKHYRSLLPERISVRVQNEGGGFWAQITAPEVGLSDCYTQADSIDELMVMINDAVQTHFEIPEEVREKVGFYLPVPSKRLRFEEMFNQLAELGKQKEEETTLTLREPELVS